MSGTQRFLFDTDFDGDSPQPQKSAIEESAETKEVRQGEDQSDPPVPLPPTFSEDEIRAAQDAAYTQGVNDGRAEAVASAEQVLTEALNKLPEALTATAASCKELEERLLRDGLRSATAVLRKLFPHLAQQNALSEVQTLIGDCLGRLRQEPRIVVRVHDNLLDSVKNAINPLSEQNGFEGRLVIIADDSLGISDVRVEWADGGAERNCERTWQQVEQIISRAASAASVAKADIQSRPSQPSQVEVPSAVSVKTEGGCLPTAGA